MLALILLPRVLFEIFKNLIKNMQFQQILIKISF